MKAANASSSAETRAIITLNPDVGLFTILAPTELAEELGWTPARLNELIKGKRGITAEAALDLAQVLGTSPEVWMNLQSHFDLAEAERKRRKAS